MVFEWGGWLGVEVRGFDVVDWGVFLGFLVGLGGWG